MNEMQKNRILAHRVVTQAHRTAPKMSAADKAVAALLVAGSLVLIALLAVAIILYVRETKDRREAEITANAAHYERVAATRGCVR